MKGREGRLDKIIKEELRKIWRDTRSSTWVVVSHNNNGETRYFMKRERLTKVFKAETFEGIKRKKR